MPRYVTCRATFVALCALLAAGAYANADTPKQVDISAGELSVALLKLAKQYGADLVYRPEQVHGLKTHGAHGQLTTEQAVTLLLQGTPLELRTDPSGAMLIAPPTAAAGSGQSTTKNVPSGSSDDGSNPKEAGKKSSQDFRLAQADQNAAGPSEVDKRKGEATDSKKTPGLEEIIVTGTHIRGTKDSPSSVEIYTRSDIDATGAITVQQFLRTLPQNFGGGASELTLNDISGGGQTNNTVNGSAPNLRGLGADATLVLINGHRVAPGNGDGDFVDVSMIPLTAIERIETVTDGASAIYGSDAVGGVVNFILRSNLEGAESRLQYGSVSNGSMHNVQAGQTVGHDWGSGSGLLSYQYSDQTPLSAGGRPYLEDAVLPLALIPEQVQHAAFANMNQEVLPGFDVHGDAGYSHRSTYLVAASRDFSGGVTTLGSSTTIDGYSGSVGLNLKLPRQSELALSATYSESDTNHLSYQTPSTQPLQTVVKTKSAIVSLDVNLDGVLISSPAGPIRYAVGGHVRRESFGNTYYFPPTDNTFYPRRTVGAGYVELRIPVMGQSAGSRGEPTLEFTLADRGEHYSDFGSTNNPQMGAIWRPLTSLTLRGTYGTSFKAPLLSQLNPVPFEVAIFPDYLFTPAPGGTLNTLSIYGGNPDLKPEKATDWTLGLEFKPLQLPGFTAKLTYYNITFRSRITMAGASICECDAFLDENIIGPAILQRNPPAALVQHWLSQPTYVDIFHVDPAAIGAIFDSRALNLSTVKTRGLDIRLAYKAMVRRAQLETGLDGTYILKFENQFTESSPAASVLNTVFSPTALRLRGRAIVTYGGVNAGVYANFTNAYTNNAITPEAHISSWTTADAVASYDFGPNKGSFDGLSLTLSITNLTNREPPFVHIPYGFGLDYDGANANPIGRYFSLLLQKRW
jgi:iron complex outermembrane receptor protein